MGHLSPYPSTNVRTDFWVQLKVQCAKQMIQSQKVIEITWQAKKLSTPIKTISVGGQKGVVVIAEKEQQPGEEPVFPTFAKLCTSVFSQTKNVNYLERK